MSDMRWCYNALSRFATDSFLSSATIFLTCLSSVDVSTVCKRTESETFKAWASLPMLCKVGFRDPRSMSHIYVRCSLERKASFSCEIPVWERQRLMASPNRFFRPSSAIVESINSVFVPSLLFHDTARREITSKGEMRRILRLLQRLGF